MIRLPLASRYLTIAVLWAAFLLSAGLRAEEAAPAKSAASDPSPGRKTQWVRLQTSKGEWDRHKNGDAKLLKMMGEQTSLNITPEWKSARATDPSALSPYPFIFAPSVATLTEVEAQNVAEYLKRGGFLLVDACINPTFNRDPRVFLQQQVAMLSSHLPGALGIELTPEHEIYSVYFKIQGGGPVTRAKGSWSYANQFPLYAIKVEKRIVCVISLLGLACAWDGSGPDNGFPEQPMNAMKMATNVYVFATMR